MPQTESQKRWQRIHGKEHGRRYYQANKEAIGKKRRARYAANREAEREMQRAYRERNKDKIRELDRRYRAANRSRHNELNKLSRQRHPETHAANESRRRARKAGNGGSHTGAEWLEKCELLGNVCTYCGEAKPLTRDHKIPLARGGSDDIENIVPACLSCNVRKGTATSREYLAKHQTLVALSL